MGAIAFREAVYAESVKEGYEKLVTDAIYENGNDMYNGTISTCELGRCRKIATEYNKSAEKRANKIIDEEDGGEKWVAKCLDLGVSHYQVMTVKKVLVKPKKPAKFVMKYAILQSDDFGKFEKVVDYADTKTLADQKMIQAQLKNPYASFVVAKRYTNINGGDDTVTKSSVTIREVKTRPKTLPANARVLEIHRYIFYGYASC